MEILFMSMPSKECLSIHPLKATLETPFSQRISIFPRENELISLGKMKIPWKNEVSKLALSGIFYPQVFCMKYCLA